MYLLRRKSRMTGLSGPLFNAEMLCSLYPTLNYLVECRLVLIYTSVSRLGGCGEAGRCRRRRKHVLRVYDAGVRYGDGCNITRRMPEE
jgi:hypothetical protein